MNYHTDDYACGALVGYVLQGDNDGLRDALGRGADPDEADSDGRPPLIHAAIDRNLHAAKVLIDAGARVDVRDGFGYTALHYAAQNYDSAMANLLIESGAPIDAEDGHGNTPLARATFESRGRGDLISLLLSAGADKNHENKRGQSPAKLAALIGNYDVEQFFR